MINKSIELVKLANRFYKRAISNELSPLKDEYDLYLTKFKNLEEDIYEMRRELGYSATDIYNGYLPVVGTLFNKYFPGHKKDLVKTISQISIPGDRASEGIFFIIHDLIHIVLENDFLGSLKRMNYNQTHSNFMDNVYEDIVSSLDLEEPGNVKRYICEWLTESLEKVDMARLSDDKLVKTYRKAIISFIDNCKDKLRESPNNAMKQLFDGIISKYKHLLLNILDNENPEKLTADGLVEKFRNNSNDIDSYAMSKINSANVLSQSEGSSLKEFLRDCYSELLNVEQNLHARARRLNY